MLAGLGGDAVGMSTVLECIAARWVGLEVCGVSLVTNAGAGYTGEPLTHEEVLEAGADAGPRLARVIRRFVADLGDERRAVTRPWIGAGPHPARSIGRWGAAAARAGRPPGRGVIEHLVGMQAQEPPDPYVGLWSRIDGFDPQELERADRGARSRPDGAPATTLHLVTARDASCSPPILAGRHGAVVAQQPLRQGPRGPRPAAVVAARARRSRRAAHAELARGKALAERWPDRMPTRSRIAAVPAAARPGAAARAWRRDGATDQRDSRRWLGQRIGRRARASTTSSCATWRPSGRRRVSDIRVWSWLTGLREVVERLRPRLRTFQDEGGRELFDVRRRADRGCGPACPDPVPALSTTTSSCPTTTAHASCSEGLTVNDLVWKGGVLIDGFVCAALGASSRRGGGRRDDRGLVARSPAAGRRAGGDADAFVCRRRRRRERAELER